MNLLRFEVALKKSCQNCWGSLLCHTEYDFKKSMCSSSNKTQPTRPAFGARNTSVHRRRSSLFASSQEMSPEIDTRLVHIYYRTSKTLNK